MREIAGADRKEGIPDGPRVLIVGLLAGLLLNVLGWLGNNFLLRSMWQEVGASLAEVEWRHSAWRDVLSLAPDFLYGIAIAWLFVRLRPWYGSLWPASLASGLFVSLVGGVTTYFAVANSGFIPWKLAAASFLLVLSTKLLTALLAGFMLEARDPGPGA